MPKRFLKNRSLGFYLVFFLVLTLAIGGSTITALADSGGATATLNGGSLTETGDFSGAMASVTLNGHDQTTSYTIPVTVMDATGTGAGWHVTITSTQFHTPGVPSILLSPFASHISGTTESCNVGSTCTAPTNSIGYPLLVPAAHTAPTPVSFFDAAANTGMGTFTVTPTITVLVPGNAYAAAYNSTITLAIASGP